MRTSLHVLDLLTRHGACPADAYRFASDDDTDGDPGKQARFDRGSAAREDLPYRVELWDEAKKGVELVLAVTANGSIGYAAFYAATREHPKRYITLRHKQSIVSRWNGPDH
jgi:hypothetical protein